MNELLKIEINDNQEQVISGRLLHEFLQISTPYAKWFGRMCGYGFIENIDYLTEDKNVRRIDGTIMPQKEINHILKINMAKELCMLARNEKGKEARQYFIKCEEEWNSPDKVMARALVIANKELSTLRIENKVMKPKAEYFDALVERETLTNFRDTAKELGIKQNKFINWLLDNDYVYRDNKNQLKPHAGYEDYFAIKDTKSDKNKWSGTQTLITPQGKTTFRLLLEAEGGFNTCEKLK